MQVTSDATYLTALASQRSNAMARPFVVALDGRSGAGKSSLALALTETRDTAIIEGDDFYAGGIDLRWGSSDALQVTCIDCTRQRTVLGALQAGQKAVWRGFDWNAFDGRLRDERTVLEPKPVIIPEGVVCLGGRVEPCIHLRGLSRSAVGRACDEATLADYVEREVAGR